MGLVLKPVSNKIDLLVFSIETKKRKLTITISATHYKLPLRMAACHVDIIVTTSQSSLGLGQITVASPL